MQNKILILDFGSQYTQLIARRIRELGVYAEIHPFNIKKEVLINFDPKGIILSGSPYSVYQTDAPKLSFDIFELNIPILGICYGLQYTVLNLGGEVANITLHREYGRADLTILNKVLIEILISFSILSISK